MEDVVVLKLTEIFKGKKKKKPKSELPLEF